MTPEVGTRAVSEQSRATTNSNRGLEPFAAAPRPLAARAAAQRTSARGGELTLVGSFPNPYGKKHAAKVTAITKSAWSPDADDFETVARAGGVANPLELKDLFALIGAIVARPPSSLKTINIITHGAPGTIGLSGTIVLPKSGGLAVASTVYFSNAWADSISLESLEKFASVPFFKKHGKKYTWGDVRARFAPGATIVVYACKSAAARGGTPSRELLQHLSEVLRTAVVGFIDPIAYCVGTQKGSLEYSMGIGTCAGPDSVKDFHQLVARGRTSKRVIEVKPATKAPARRPAAIKKPAR